MVNSFIMKHNPNIFTEGLSYIQPTDYVGVDIHSTIQLDSSALLNHIKKSLFFFDKLIFSFGFFDSQSYRYSYNVLKILEHLNWLTKKTI